MRSEKKAYTRSWPQRVFYSLLRITARLVAVSLYRIRVFGRENWPTEGGALVCANHQGFFDPVLVGLCCERQLSFLAKQSLFKFPLKPLIETLNAIPVNRAGTGLDGLKETLKRLRGGDFVLIFPEGTRSENGDMGNLKPGFIAVARKGKAPIVPVVFDGSFQAWPKWQLLPSVGMVHVKIGQPIAPEEMAELTDDQLLAKLQERMHAMFAEMQYSRARSLNPRIHTADKTQFA
ncbi:lysophospholipid acyltransferase family protein [Blastopirellula marina]|uniref:1-acyl-sn-glycerol-3-phosphate acyltransferase n=1 Tax=Blastopirellula marina TaxID=124 RepID=A0A2S8GBE7_9BACT|nr:lysophospholipid acyltransferase family protein [Blastopirellula marina]PQO41753.1 1-acyl-sn-glycerol-3-phosphate acyltransferase [Blastopirellula marina]PTL46196.1 1-acyl-sn-glycerol-3-phosphate acyltransferase [Blastopirellula marina]